jgi:hypothetical protein
MVDLMSPDPNPSLGEIKTVPERKLNMPYAPAIRVEAPGDLLFISGATPSPLYHKHRELASLIARRRLQLKAQRDRDPVCI